MELYDIIKKLNGNIKPYGSHNTDMENLNHLKEFCEITIKMVEDLIEVAKSKDSVAYSMQVLGREANETLKELHEMTYTK